MTRKEYEDYIRFKTAEGIKNTEARFDHLKRTIELNTQIQKEKEDLLLNMIMRKPKLVQLRLFDDHNFDIELFDNALNNCELRMPAGIMKVY